MRILRSPECSATIQPQHDRVFYCQGDNKPPGLAVIAHSSQNRLAEHHGARPPRRLMDPCPQGILQCGTLPSHNRLTPKGGRPCLAIIADSQPKRKTSSVQTMNSASKPNELPVVSTDHLRRSGRFLIGSLSPRSTLCRANPAPITRPIWIHSSTPATFPILHLLPTTAPSAVVVGERSCGRFSTMAPLPP